MKREEEESASYTLEMKNLCDKVRTLLKMKDYEQCLFCIVEGMKKYPHAPDPHNLMGVLLEYQEKHTLAMRHFKAAWSLDPTHLASQYNLSKYSEFSYRGGAAIDASDIK